MATSILATGVDTVKAYQVASIIETELHRLPGSEIAADDLVALGARMLEIHGGREIAQRYLDWRRVKRMGRPLVLSLVGGSGVGKSTFATRLALRLGINRAVTTDAIREVLRTVIPDAVLPELHVSTYEAIDAEAGTEGLSIFLRQSRAVAFACAAVAKRYIQERRSVIFEGVHLLPGLLSQQLKGLEEKPVVVELLLFLEEESLHQGRLAHRASSEPGRDGTRHLLHFKVIRRLQQELRRQAQRAGVPEFEISHPEGLTQQVVENIVRATEQPS